MRVVAGPAASDTGRVPYETAALEGLIDGEGRGVATVGKIGDGPGRTTSNLPVRTEKITSPLCRIASIRGKSLMRRRSARVEGTRRATNSAHSRSSSG
jgi:hypothetical protein